MKKTLSIVAIVCLNMIFNIIPNYGKAIESSKSLCIYDARIRSIDEKKYVKEALLVDFEKVDLPESISLKNCFMVDNGEGNDKVAGDGIYTSTEIFSHNETMPFEKVGVPISKLEKPIVQPGFDKVRELVAYGRAYKYRNESWIDDSSNPQWIFEITCEVETGLCCCPATDLGLCSSCCIRFHDCSVTIGF